MMKVCVALPVPSVPGAPWGHLEVINAISPQEEGAQIPFRLTKASVQGVQLPEALMCLKDQQSFLLVSPSLQYKFKEAFILKGLNCNKSLCPALDYNGKFIHNSTYQKCPNS